MDRVIGLKKGTVKLLAHNKKWAEYFKREKGKIIKALSADGVAGIEHIGSTAIKTIKAKPVIDVVIGIKSINDINKTIRTMKKAGYKYIKSYSNRYRHLFVRGGDDRSTAHLHVVKYKGVNWQKTVMFRDHLNSNNKVAREYEKLKQKLYIKYPYNRVLYTKSKNKFIEGIITKLNKKKKWN